VVGSTLGSTGQKTATHSNSRCSPESPKHGAITHMLITSAERILAPKGCLRQDAEAKLGRSTTGGQQMGCKQLVNLIG
jgi:hypothetical protein